MRRRGFLNPSVLWREFRRWTDRTPPGPQDGHDPARIAFGRSRLVVAQDEHVLGAGAMPEPKVVRALVAQGLRMLTQAADERAAWQTLLPGLRPGHVVGLKINTIGVHLVPHQGVLDALVASLSEAGVVAADVVIWDNLGRLDCARRTIYGDAQRAGGAYFQGMEAAGFAPDARATPRLLCTLPTPPGLGYDQEVCAEIPSQRLRLPVTRILSRVCDHVINVPVPKDHLITGVTCALKNFYGCVPLWDAFCPSHAARMHVNRGDPQVAELYANPAISGKVRLHVCDALQAICDGGPFWGRPQLEPRSLLFATDPVALDAYILAMIDAARRDRGLERIARRARYIESAARLGLGTNDPDSIDLVGPTGVSLAWPS
jgi:hypothetical protein